MNNIKKLCCFHFKYAKIKCDNNCITVSEKSSESTHSHSDHPRNVNSRDFYCHHVYRIAEHQRRAAILP